MLSGIPAFIPYGSFVIIRNKDLITGPPFLRGPAIEQRAKRTTKIKRATRHIPVFMIGRL
jgi:hypothetical protein